MCFEKCVHSYVQRPDWNQKVAIDCSVFLLGRFDDNFVFFPLQAVPRHTATFGSVTSFNAGDISLQAFVERRTFERESHKYNFLERERVLKCIYPNMFAPRPRITCEGCLWPVCKCERKMLVVECWTIRNFPCMVVSPNAPDCVRRLSPRSDLTAPVFFQPCGYEWHYLCLHW